MSGQLVEVDERRRVTLGKIGNREHIRYLATEQADGTIILTPAVVMSEAEARFLANPELVAMVAENREHPERRTRRSKG